MAERVRVFLSYYRFNINDTLYWPIRHDTLFKELADEAWAHFCAESPAEAEAMSQDGIPFEAEVTIGDLEFEVELYYEKEASSD